MTEIVLLKTQMNQSDSNAVVLNAVNDHSQLVWRGNYPLLLCLTVYTVFGREGLRKVVLEGEVLSQKMFQDVCCWVDVSKEKGNQ